MHIDDTISEFIGALANMAVVNKSGLLQKSEVVDILTIAKVENSTGDSYKNPKGLVKKAVEYWEAQDRSTVVNNIKTVFPF